MDSTITRTTSDPDPLVPFVRFAKSLWKVVNSQAMAKLVGSDGSL
jgi:hypothetical protein